MKRKVLLLCILAPAVFPNSLMAAVSADEAKQLGGATLTAWGAEKAGNKEGTIPPYTGERPKVPASYNPKELGNMPDPYASENRPLQNGRAYAGSREQDFGIMKFARMPFPILWRKECGMSNQER